MTTITPEFLATLTRLARTYGWLGDHIATCDFVAWCYEEAGAPRPTDDQLAPFLDGEDE